VSDIDEKISVRFPAEHPVLKYPPGKRSQRVRELVDTALRLESILSSIDSRLARLEGILVSDPDGLVQPGTEKNDEKKPLVFDVDAFTNL